MKTIFYEIGTDGLPINSDILSAIDGLGGMNYNYDTKKPIHIIDIVVSKYNDFKNNIFICSFRGMQRLFWNQIKIDIIDYPEEIKHLFNRKITLSTVENILSLGQTNVFMKPFNTKAFDGFYGNTKNIKHLKTFDKDMKIWISPVIDIESEWRIFVHKGEVVHASCYAGNFRVMPDYNYIDNIVKSYLNSPIAYALDIAVLKDKTNDIVEVNDFWGIGSYGLNSAKYAEMLIDRYYEIVNKGER